MFATISNSWLINSLSWSRHLWSCSRFLFLSSRKIVSSRIVVWTVVLVRNFIDLGELDCVRILFSFFNINFFYSKVSSLIQLGCAMLLACKMYISNAFILYAKYTHTHSRMRQTTMAVYKMHAH